MKKDFIGRNMTWKPSSLIQSIYGKYREPLLYLFFGGITFFLSIGLFWAFIARLGMKALSANIVDWIVCVIFAYLTNRKWVFKDKGYGARSIITEFGSFLIGRLGTLALEEFVLWLGIDLFHINAMIVKILVQVLVIVGNYVLSKFFVFKKRAGGGDE